MPNKGSLRDFVRRVLRLRPRDAIEKTWTEDDPTFGYRPSRDIAGELILDELPLFTLRTARLMLKDPVVQIGLTCRNAALAAAKIEITCKDARVREWLGKQWQYLWSKHRTALLRTKIYGHAGFQLEFAKNRQTGLIDIVGLKEFAPEDVRPLSYGGRVAAIRVKARVATPVLLPPRGVFLSCDDDAGNAGGSSLLKRSYSPWWEKHMPTGALSTRRLRLIKDAYIGDVLQFPYAEIVNDEMGNPVSWRDIMRSISEARLAGSTIVLPRKMDAEGRDQITYTPPQDTGSPVGIYEWCDRLDTGIWQGLGVFEEVIQAAETGSGFSGRSIPLTIFLAGCEEELTQVLKGLDQFAFAPLVFWNFGANVEYEINPVPLVKVFADEMGGSPMGGESMGGQQSSQGPPPGGQPPQQGQPAKPMPPKPKPVGPANGKRPTQFYEPAESDGIPTIDYSTSDAIANRTVSALRAAMRLTPSEIRREVAKQRTTSKRLRGREALSAVLGAIPLILARKREVAQEIAEDGLFFSAVAGAAAAQTTIEREMEISQLEIAGSTTAVAPPVAPPVESITVPTFIPESVETPESTPQPEPQPEQPEPPKGRVPSTESTFGRRKRVRFPNEIRARKKLRDSVAVAGQDYRETARLVRENAFAITTRMSDDVVAHIRDALKKNMHEGMDLKSFIESVEKIQRGQEYPLSRARIELVFRANTARYLSDAADAALNHPLSIDQFPYRAYSATHDDRVRDEHLRLEQTGLNGTNVYRADDPAWKAFRPPWAYNCRCAWRPVGVRQAARIGVVEANNWLARATARANAEGGLADQYLVRVKPASGEMVPWPTIDGEPFYPSPEWNRTGVQFAESWGRITAAKPTEAQKEAGNYRKGHVTWNGLNIAIENPRGSVRKGDGWQSVMKSHYGYIKSTEGKDGDHVDVFLGPDCSSQIIFVVNQIDQNGRFDEHKIMIGWTNHDEAKAGYLANYSKGWKCGPIVSMTLPQFKEWLKNGNTKKPCCEQFAEIQRGLFGDEFDVESKPAKPQKKAKPESTERQGMLWTGLDLKPGQRDFLDEQGDAITEDTRKAGGKSTPAKDAGFEAKHPRAPKGGATIKGEKYDGGEFVPAKTLEHLAKQTGPIGLRDLGEAVGMAPGPSHDPLKSPLNRALVTLTDQGLIQSHESKSGFGEPGISLTDKGREHVKKQSADRPRELADDELSTREVKRAYERCLASPEDCSDRDLIRSAGYANRLVRHYRKDGDNATADSIERESENFRRIVKARERGELPDVEHESEEELIARQVVEEKRNLNDVAREMGLNDQEIKIARPAIMKAIELERELEGESQELDVNPARKRAQELRKKTDEKVKAAGGGGVTKRHRQAIEDYSTDKFQRINGELRSGKLSADVARDVKAMDEGLARMPKYTAPTIRSFNVPDGPDGDKIRSMLDTGSTFSDPAYISARKKPLISDSVAFRDKKPGPNQVVLKITGRDGADISDVSLNKSEGEVLYPRGTKFKVQKVQKFANGAVLAELVQESYTDGFSLIDDRPSLPERSVHYAIFDNKAIKSATSNRGTFDPDDSNILFREAAQSGWITLGGGSSVFVDEGRIELGCPGLKGEEISDLIDEPDASRAKRKKRQDKAESLGITGEEVSIKDLEKLEDGEAPTIDDDSFDFGPGVVATPEAIEADPTEEYQKQATEFALGLGYGPEILGIDRAAVNTAMANGTPPELFAQSRIGDWMAQFQPGVKVDTTNRQFRKGTKLYKQISESVADESGTASEDDIQYFGSVLLDVLGMRQQEAIEWNQTRREMLHEMGLSDGMSAARIAKEINSGKDATQLKRFDEIMKVLRGERGGRYRTLLKATQSESEGKGDDESALMELLSTQQKRVPTLNDQEIWSDAWNAAQYAMSREKTYDPDEDYWKSVEFSEPKHWALNYWDWKEEYFAATFR